MTKTGRQGRPRKVIDPGFLEAATSSTRNISLSQLARSLHVHRHTVRAYLERSNIDYGFSNILDEELDLLVSLYNKDKPESGIRYVTGFLRHHGLRVQRHRIAASLRRVDPVGRALQERLHIVRQVYQVARPNALWHINGHHKPICWALVIHAITDRYDRKALGMKASNNNHAETVHDGVFTDAVDVNGFPSHIQGDHGSENKEVAITMIQVQGPN